MLMVLFVRPALMVMGLLGAMVIVEPMVGLVNETFFTAMRAANTNSLVGILLIFGFMVVSVSIIFTIMNKSFSLIHMIPDKVLRWVGGGPEQLGEQQAGEEAKSLVLGGVMRGQGAATQAATFWYQK